MEAGFCNMVHIPELIYLCGHIHILVHPLPSHQSLYWETLNQDSPFKQTSELWITPLHKLPVQNDRQREGNVEKQSPMCNNRSVSQRMRHMLKKRVRKQEERWMSACQGRKRPLLLGSASGFSKASLYSQCGSASQNSDDWIIRLSRLRGDNAPLTADLGCYWQDEIEKRARVAYDAK